MGQDEKNLIYLAACVLNDTHPDQASIANMNLDSLLYMAKKHKMASVAASAIRSAGVSASNFSEAQVTGLIRSRTMDHDRKAVLSALEDACIWYMPLKGLVLREYYPRPELREMVDNDILFDRSRAADVRKIMKSLGFKTCSYGTGHQDDYRKKPVSHFEMHRMLFNPKAPPRVYKYYKRIDKKLHWGKGFSRFFSKEDFYLYMITHEYKHYYWHGTGLRSLMDTYVFLSKFSDSLDWRYLRREMKKLGITDFEKKNRLLAKKVFSPGGITKLSPKEEHMLKYFSGSGAFGNNKKDLKIELRRKGKAQYIFKRIFMPMEQVKQHYPFFYKHKTLLPMLPFYRLAARRKNISYELERVLDNDEILF